MFNLFKKTKKQEQEEMTCFGCKHLWERNDGSYECLIKAEKACINEKKRKTVV